MKFFYLKNCPYCKQAIQWMEELSQENSNYQKVKIEWIEESENLSYADAYDYYYVPCFFDGEKKVHEGIASKEIIRRIFDDYIRRIAK